MPRRRMLDPSFTEDIEVGQLTRDERCFLIGCLRNADDEGRLKGNRAFLKAEIFMYDDDIDLKRMQEIKESTLKKAEHWRPENIWRLAIYQNGEQEYLYFPNWADMEKPSHPTPSKLPAPPSSILPKPPEVHSNSSRASPEERTKTSGETPPQSSLGQSSLVEFSTVKSSAVQEDFTKFLYSEKDLTDFLNSTLERYLPRGPTWALEVLKKLWEQALGEPMKQTIFELTLKAVKEYPVSVLARAYAKAVKYRGGKYGSWKYLDKILKEEMGKASISTERNKPP